MNGHSDEKFFFEYLAQGAKKLELFIDEPALKRLAIHYLLLQKWSRRMNLTAVRGARDVAEKLYLESALLATLLEKGRMVLDAGSGAGFPGLVIKAVRPELSLVLVEAREKKAAFLSLAARQMGLSEGIWVKNLRLGWSDFEMRFGEAVSRAAFPPDVWCAMAPGLVEPGGRIWFFLNGTKDAGSAGISPPDGFSVSEIRHYRLPFGGQERTLLSLRRLG